VCRHQTIRLFEMKTEMSHKYYVSYGRYVRPVFKVTTGTLGVWSYLQCKNWILNWNESIVLHKIMFRKVNEILRSRKDELNFRPRFINQWQQILSFTRTVCIFFFFFNGSTAPFRVPMPPHFEASRSHSLDTPHSVGDQPVNLTTHNTHKRQTSVT
jgi:hypothetical protein